mmetsp:Transcript_3770/g.5601  ORF Transcript_3770/g.5601 Transcript_3770/m.5601 type:complete len:90 (-) Transcript_3770:814-1083(-)
MELCNHQTWFISIDYYLDWTRTPTFTKLTFLSRNMAKKFFGSFISRKAFIPEHIRLVNDGPRSVPLSLLAPLTQAPSRKEMLRRAISKP